MENIFVWAKPPAKGGGITKTLFRQMGLSRVVVTTVLASAKPQQRDNYLAACNQRFATGEKGGKVSAFIFVAVLFKGNCFRKRLGGDLL
jgi:hypothetical protein